MPAGTITNVVNASTPTPGTSLASLTAVASTEVVLEADLSVTKTLATNPVVAGLPVVYDFTVTNAGPSDAINATLIDAFPPGTSYAGGLTPPGTVCEVSEVELPAVSCVLTSLPAGETVTGQLILDTSPDLTGTIVNTGIVGSDALDPDDSDNVSTSSATVVAADSAVDLAVTKTGPAELQAGGTFSYFVIGRQRGRVIVDGSHAHRRASTGLVPTEATIDGTPCAISGQQVSCPVGMLTPGGTPAAITINGTVDPAIAATTVDNTATATPVGTETDPTDNSATATSTITRMVDLAVSKVALSDPFLVGTSVGWTLTVTNGGSSAALDVVVTDSLPAGFTLDAGLTDDRCALTLPDEVSCDVGTVLPAARSRW